MFKHILISTILTVSFAGIAFSGDTNIRVVDKPDAEMGNDFYIGNRTPLMPSPLIKLPIKAIILAQGIQQLRLHPRRRANDQRIEDMDRSGAGQPERRRLVWAGQGQERSGDKLRGPRRPLA